MSAEASPAGPDERADAGESDRGGGDALRRLRHELRTPVNHILGYGELLLEQATDDGDDALVAPLEAICAAARDALGLINDLLDIAKQRHDGGDWARAAERLAPLLDCIDSRGLALRTEAGARGQTRLVADLERIALASGHLRALLRDGPGGEGQGPDGGTPGAAGAPATERAMGAAGSVTDHAVPDTPPDEWPTASGTLLLVDDSEPNRDMLARRLERLGYRVLLAEDGRQALDILATAPVDLVLLDIMMPVMDGYEVLERRRADPGLRDLPFIVISALDELDSVVRCIAMGAEDYLPKPFDPVLLRARIGASLEKKRLRDQEREHLATIERQAAELAEWNRLLEARVQQQVQELERLARLRRFLSPQVAEVIVSSGDERVLESHRRVVTVVFTDLRGFTAFAGGAEPEAVMEVLGEYHQAMGELIFRYEGTLERFAGDGLMVFFNDPIPCADHTLRAVQMAVAMRAAVGELAARWQARGYQLGFGVGIAQGEATLGKIGFEGRFDYAAIGTTTNLASRLCDEARTGQILVNERAYAAIATRVRAEPVPALSLKGIATPVRAYSVLGLQTDDA